jgi:hypothetical protein
MLRKDTVASTVAKSAKPLNSTTGGDAWKSGLSMSTTLVIPPALSARFKCYKAEKEHEGRQAVGAAARKPGKAVANTSLSVKRGGTAHLHDCRLMGRWSRGPRRCPGTAKCLQPASRD